MKQFAPCLLHSTWQMANFPPPLILIPFHKTFVGPISDEYVEGFTHEKEATEDFFQGYDVVRSSGRLLTTPILPMQHLTIAMWIKGGKGSFRIEKLASKTSNGLDFLDFIYQISFQLPDYFFSFYRQSIFYFQV